jgi:hypothetical protein
VLVGITVIAVNRPAGKGTRAYFGTDIKVIDSNTKKQLLLIGWSGGEFYIKKK